jgi:hypothetical protein
MDSFFEYYSTLNIIIDNNPNNNNVAVIVEPRKHKYLLGVIKNVMSNLDESWNLHIFGSDNNEEHIKNNILGNFKFTNLQINDLNQISYSLLFQSLAFWENIIEENILIFQTDSFINNPNYKIPFEYGFIGATYNYGYSTNDIYIDIVCPKGYNYNLSGGFSFRHKSLMIECIKNVSLNDIIEYRKKNNLNIELFINKYILLEDNFFINAIVILGYELPSQQICNDFCSQQTINYNSFGVHGFDKQYAGFTNEVIKLFTKQINQQLYEEINRQINEQINQQITPFSLNNGTLI